MKPLNRKLHFHVYNGNKYETTRRKREDSSSTSLHGNPEKSYEYREFIVRLETWSEMKLKRNEEKKLNQWGSKVG